MSPVDVTSDASVQQFTAWVQQTYGRVDILVNNAGVNPTMQPEESSLLTVQIETMLTTLTTNVLAVARITQSLVPLMKAQNYGRIVNVFTEMASLTSMGSDYYPLAPSYRLSKVGLNALTALWAKELQGTNILVNLTLLAGCKRIWAALIHPSQPMREPKLPSIWQRFQRVGRRASFLQKCGMFGGAVALAW